MKTLLLHIPALHQGYVKLFEGVAPEVDRLAIIDSEIISTFPELAREVRAIKPELMKKIVESLGIFKQVVLIGNEEIKELATDQLVMADEEITDVLTKKYAFKKVKKINPFFALGYKERSVGKRSLAGSRNF